MAFLSNALGLSSNGVTTLAALVAFAVWGTRVLRKLGAIAHSIKAVPQLVATLTLHDTRITAIEHHIGLPATPAPVTVNVRTV